MSDELLNELEGAVEWPEVPATNDAGVRTWSGWEDKAAAIRECREYNAAMDAEGGSDGE